MAKYTTESLKKYYLDNGCELLDEYKSFSSSMKYRCSCGKISTCSWRHFKNGSRCRDCRNKKMTFTYDYVKSYFEQQNCELLETNYKNARTKMKYRCSCGTEAYVKLYRFKVGDRCKKCSVLKLKEKLTLSQKEAEARFEKNGCKLLESYKGADIPIKYLCECGEEALARPMNIWKGRRCKACGIAKRSGINHYDWISDRDKVKSDFEFRQRCYKMVKQVLKVTGRVKNTKTALLLGYDYIQLQNYVFNHPNWNNVKDKAWHIDHIFPIKAFLDRGITDMKIINALDNLQPLEALENMCKNAKYDEQDFITYLSKKGVIKND